MGTIARFPTLDGQDRQLTPDLWNNAREQWVEADPASGQFYFEDFVETLLGNTTDASAQEGWYIEEASAAGATAESFVSAVVAGGIGVAVLSATTGTDEQGIEAHRGSSATTGFTVNLPTHGVSPQGRVIYETRVNLNDADSDQFFIGLAEPGIDLLIAAGALAADRDYIGFYRLDGGGIQFVCANDNAGGTAVTDAVTIVADADVPTNEWVRLGFSVNENLTVDIFYNGQRIGRDTSGVDIVIDTDALPIETLTEKYAITRGATGDNANLDLPIDWVGTFVDAP
jgi:hypothetical protein